MNLRHLKYKKVPSRGLHQTGDSVGPLGCRNQSFFRCNEGGKTKKSINFHALADVEKHASEVDNDLGTSLKALYSNLKSSQRVWERRPQRIKLAEKLLPSSSAKTQMKNSTCHKSNAQTPKGLQYHGQFAMILLSRK